MKKGILTALIVSAVFSGLTGASQGEINRRGIPASVDNPPMKTVAYRHIGGRD